MKIEGQNKCWIIRATRHQETRVTKDRECQFSGRGRGQDRGERRGSAQCERWGNDI